MDNYSAIISEICASREQKFEYDGRDPGIEVIDRILKNAYTSVPSKQLVMPYNVHVYGPSRKKEKDIIFNYSAFRSANAIPEQCANYQLQNAPYILLFTTRTPKIEDYNSENFVGLYPDDYFNVNDRDPAMEIGMFMMLLVMYTKSENLDISFCNCITLDKIEDELQLPGKLWGSMSIGYAVDIEKIKDPYIQYKHNSFKQKHFPSRAFVKPSFETIVNYI